MLILGHLGMYFDDAVVFVTSQTLLFRLALAILCLLNTYHLTMVKMVEQCFFFQYHYPTNVFLSISEGLFHVGTLLLAENANF